MRIGIAQINPVLGDFENNKEKILTHVREARSKKCSLVVFPECALFGYHPFDLLEREGVVDAQLKAFAELQKEIPADLAVIVGLITKNQSKLGKPYFNSAALLVKGKKPRIFHKTLLPTGDVFDEARFIESGDMTKNVFTWKGKKFFLSICEDIWAWPDSKGRSLYRRNPLKSVPKSGFDLLINLSASPWHVGKLQKRDVVTAKTAALLKAPLLYVNMVGAQDEIIFDGRSFVMGPKGKKQVECLAFEEHLNVFDLDTMESWTPRSSLDETEELRQALVLGMRDFSVKTGIRKAHLGLSGGIDSAVVACLAVEALGAGAVKGFGLPGPFSSPESLSLARDLAKNLGVAIQTLSIQNAFDTIQRDLDKAWDLGPLSVVHENLQSRLRGLFMMAYANKENSLLLTTGNKSEYATGYATLYGDMCGGLAPIGDLTKEQVYALARHYNLEREVIPEKIITRPPTAELRPDQKDQDSLPPYAELDAAVEELVEKCGKAKKPVEKWLVAQLFKTEFKRWQAAPILKASAHSFGRGRRYPVAHRAKE
ncbi:MAG: NAD+ synthase [Bdellovibrionaceae bacterium]|nr:NAD+ synthase [Pseudobdellovibrionaceae bacterium]